MIPKRFKPSLRTPRAGLVFAAALFAIGLASPQSFGASPAAGAQPPFTSAGLAGVSSIDYIELTGLIDPPSARFLQRQIRSSQSDGAEALIIRIDSPGGLGIPVSKMLRTIRASKVPVVAWIAPIGAKADSVGSALALAAQVLVVSPGGRLGNPSPADLNPGAVSGGLSDKVLAGLIRRRLSGGDPSAAQTALRRGLSADEAVKIGLADYSAPSLPSLLAGLRDRTVYSGGAAVTLGARQFLPRFHKMGMFERLFHGSIRPAAAYLLVLAGAFAILFELYNPGVGGAAISGGVAAAFGLYGLSVLPVSWLGFVLVLGALVLLFRDLQASRLGPATLLGSVFLVGGSLLMFHGLPSPLRLPWWALAAGVASVYVFFFQVIPAAMGARTARPLSGTEGIVGARGIARTDVAPQGQVMARGTLWRARTLGAAIAQGTEVEIKGTSGLILMVEPVEKQ